MLIHACIMDTNINADIFRCKQSLYILFYAYYISTLYMYWCYICFLFLCPYEGIFKTSIVHSIILLCTHTSIFVFLEDIHRTRITQNVLVDVIDHTHAYR